jgi:glycosyltransferase involved in cell wall biosynthesis
MRILHLSTSDRGGAGIAALRIHQAMIRNGIDSHFVTLKHAINDVPNHPPYKPQEGYALPLLMRFYFFCRKVLNYTGILQYPHIRIAKKHLKGRPAGYESFSFCTSIYNLKKHPLFKSADIIHLHWVTEGFVDFESFFNRIEKKIVWTLHDMNPFTGGCHHSDESLGYLSDCSNCPQLRNTVDMQFAAKVLKRKINSHAWVDDKQMQIVAPSSWLSSIASHSMLFRRFRHYVVPNGIDSGIFRVASKYHAREKLKLPGDKKIILFISHTVTHPRKGIAYLLEAFRTMNRPDVVLVSVGSSGVEEDGVINLGYVSDDNTMAEIYSAADVFVLPSVAENFPNTICEALLCGIPVVAFRVGGIPEVVDAENGILVPVGNTPELKNAIEHVIDHPEKYPATLIREKAVLRLSDDIAVNKYMEIYNTGNQNE